MVRRFSLSLLSTVALGLGALILSSASADTTWTGATNSDWSTASNWNNGLPGTGNADAIINTTTNFPILSSGTGNVDRDIRIGTGLTGRLDQTGGTLNTGLNSWFFLGYVGANATYNLADTAGTGGTLTGFAQGTGSVNVGGANQNGNMFIGLDNGTVSTLNINTTGTLAAGGLWVGANGGTSSTGIVNLDSGTVNISGETQFGSSFFGNGKNGTLNMSGGSFTADIVSFARGNNGAAAMNGTANITGGTLSSKRYFTLGFAGNASNVSTVNNSGGTVNVNTQSGGPGVLEMGVFDLTQNTFNQNSGTVTLQNNASIVYGVGGNHSGASTFNHNGGTVTFYSDSGTTVGGTGSVNLGNGNSTGTYAYNLNGGILSSPQVSKTGANASGTFNFNGGTLTPTASTVSFMQGLTRANVRDGGAVVNTNGFDATIGQSLEHSNISGDAAIDGGLTKNGLGTLTLTGGSTYTGKTFVNGGVLLVNGTHTGGGAYAVGSAGTLGGTGSISAAGVVIDGTLAPGVSPGTLTVSSDLSFGATATFAAELLGTNTVVGSGVNDLVNGVANLTLDGTLNVTETTAGSFLSAVDGNKWRLIDYTGLLTDNGLALGVLPALSSGLYYQVDTSVAGQVNLLVTSVPEASAFLGVGLVTLLCGAGYKLRRR